MLINRTQSITVVILSALALLWSFAGFAVTQTELEKLTPQQAFDKGKLLHWQYKDAEARPYLKYAADQGNGSAAMMYASIRYSDKPTLGGSKVDYDYIFKAANQYLRSAMFTLSSFDSPLSKSEKLNWKHKAEALLKKQMQNNEADAFYVAAYRAAIDNPMGHWGCNALDLFSNFK